MQLFSSACCQWPMSYGFVLLTVCQSPYILIILLPVVMVRQRGLLSLATVQLDSIICWYAMLCFLMTSVGGAVSLLVIVDLHAQLISMFSSLRRLWWGSWRYLCSAEFFKLSFHVLGPNKVSQCLSIHRKFFFDLNKIWFIVRRWWVLRDSRSHDPFWGQGQGHRGPKVTKVANFKVYPLLRRYTCNLKTNAELWMILKTMSKL